MINLVIVSHSLRLAQGVMELAQQMIKGETCRLVLAAGIEAPDATIGTDAIRVMEAIESVSDADGIVVLMDLGSALLSAETALELLSEEVAAKVRLSSAPLVEGTLAATVAAAGGATLEQVLAEAEGALRAKRVQLGIEAMEEGGSRIPTVQDTQTVSWTVRNPQGLHIRPASRLAEVLSKFDAKVLLEKQGKCVDPLSLTQVAMLQVRCGDTVHLIASGPQRREAIDAFTLLAQNHFEEKIAEVSEASACEVQLPVSGVVLNYKQPVWELQRRTITASEVGPEQQRLQQAIDATLKDLRDFSHRAETCVGKGPAEIFSGHAMLLEEPDWLNEAKAIIANDRVCAALAWQQVLTEVASQYQQLNDSYLRARELDIRDLLQRSLGHLLSSLPPPITASQPTILIADELFPSEMVQLSKYICGIYLRCGDLHSHSTILAKALGLPVLVGLPHLGAFRDGQRVTLDVMRGKLDALKV